ncbi:ATP-binding protein [Haloferula chungangensis]|uniref:ATP-binding protein n=1 Tax=Haloferula chungangensis TaxID=1048331 RepID=A0ABW2L9F8_9BACT
MNDLERSDFLRLVEESLGAFKLTVLWGAPRMGKSTLLRLLEWEEENFFDLEDPMDQAIFENPGEALGKLRGLVVIDGLHYQADLLPLLLDRAKSWGGPSRFLVVGRASREMRKQVASITDPAMNVIELGGLNVGEVGFENRDRLWWRGGIPESFMAPTDGESARFREAFIQTFLRRDLPGQGIDLPAERLRRFLVLTARHQGQPWNSSAIAKELGVSHPTARAYLELLTDCGILRQLSPLIPPGSKRMVKAPKVYVRDSGLVHELLGVTGMEGLKSNPLLGLSWESFAMEQLVSVLRLRADEMFFWRTHGGAEMDVVIERDGRRYGFDFQTTDEPRVTHSMTIAKADLGLDSVFLVHPGERSFSLREGMAVLGYPALAAFVLS